MTDPRDRQSSGLMVFVERVLNLPRLARILLVGYFAVSMTLSISPLVDDIYLRYFFSMETRLLPALVSAAAGGIMYIVGWRLVIGTVGTRPPARPVVLWYLVIGLLAVFLLIVLIVDGLNIVTQSDNLPQG